MVLANDTLTTNVAAGYASDDHIVFSIVLPTHNRAHLLPLAVNSILAQTFPLFELIIVNDGSTDGTEQTIASFSDRRIVPVKHETPKGVSAARNSALRLARGKYVSFLDDDDEYMPQFLEKTLEFFEKAPEDIGFVWTGVRWVDVKRDGTHQVFDRLWNVDHETGTQIRKSRHILTQLAASFGLTVRRACFDKIGLFDESLLVSEDIDLLFRLVTAEFRYHAIPMVLIKVYVYEATSLSRSTNYAARAESEERLVQKNLSLLEAHPDLWLHYQDSLAGAYYRAGNKAKARITLVNMLHKNPFRLKTWEKLIRFELKRS